MSDNAVFGDVFGPDEARRRIEESSNAAWSDLQPLPALGTPQGIVLAWCPDLQTWQAVRIEAAGTSRHWDAYLHSEPITATMLDAGVFVLQFAEALSEQGLVEAIYRRMREVSATHSLIDLKDAVNRGDFS